MRGCAVLIACLLQVCLALVPGAASGAPAPAVPLSRNGHAEAASLGIDAAGGALAVWQDDGAWFSDHPPGGVWSPPVAVPAMAMPGLLPVVRVAADGQATLVSWRDGEGVWAADRQGGGVWGGATLLVAAPAIVAATRTGVPDVQFVMNSAGAALVVFEQLVAGRPELVAVRRAAGAAAWGPPEPIASAAEHGALTAAAVAIGEAGDALVVWESFAAHCGTRLCGSSSFVPHASRAAPGGAWITAAAALAPVSPFDAYAAQAAIDERGRAVVALSIPWDFTVTTITQVRGGGWSMPAVAVRLYPAFPSLRLAGIATGPGESASLVVAGLSAAGDGVLVVPGNLARNRWRAPLDLAERPSRAATPVAVAASPAGGLALAWTDRDGAIRMAARPHGGAAFAPARTVAAGAACGVPGLQCTVATATAINAAGQAVALFTRTPADGGARTLFGVTE